MAKEDIKDQEQEPVTDESTENTDSETQTTENTQPETEETSQTADQLAQLQLQLDEQKDKYLRLYSDFENLRRRTAKEKLELIKTASESLMVSLLPVMDDFERALKAFNEGKDKDANKLKEGVELIANKFNKTLKDKGLKEMEVPQGTDFDVELHEAITHIPAPSEELKGKVVDVVEKGYLLEDKVIRYAKVVTGS